MATSFESLYETLYGGETDYEFNVEKTDKPFSQIIDLEIRNGIQSMKSGKVTGIKGLTSEMLKGRKDLLITPLKILFNSMIEHQQIPKEFALSKTILLPKKGQSK